MSDVGLSGAPPFSETGELPGPGITLIEASAGTGKTHTLTSLVVRYVAAGVPLSAILAVTFTRMATGELRERIRDRMVAVHASLAGAGGAGGAGGDEIVSLLSDCTAPELAARRDRLAAALAEFDSATIATVHGFCHLAIGGLGATGDVAPGTVLLEDSSDLRGEVVADLYLKERLSHPATSFSLAEARRAAELAVAEPAVRLVPAPGDDPAGRLARLACAVREQVAERLLQGGFVTYDEMLSRLARALEDPVRGPVASSRLAERYQVVVVDEFQDTDPVQWRILDRAFGGGTTTLVLIGDPKQAIYAFRGADVLAYLDAARRADRRYTLTVNRRSDQGLLDALGLLFQPLQFGHRGIPFRPVNAPEGAPLRRMTGAPVGAPVRFRVVPAERGPALTKRGLHRKDALVDWVATDLAADVGALLSSGAEIAGEAGAPPAPLRASDIAVLTRSNRQAKIVRDALVAAGLPAVTAGNESVFDSEGAADWLTLLDGLTEPTSRERVAAVALSAFIGMSPAEVAGAEERRWEEMHDRLVRWSSLVATAGIAVLYQQALAETDLPGRLLGRIGGERILTDVGHVAQLLHSEASTTLTGPAGLRAWLSARREAAAEEQTAADDRSRRLDSDAEAVQVTTIHKVKGLEYPVVYCPFLWDAGREPAGAVVVHEPSQRTDRPAGLGERVIDVGCPTGSGPSVEREHEDRIALAAAEARGEDLRLMYVALTRARHQVVMWWGRPQDVKKSPLARILLGRDPATGIVSDLRVEPKTADVLAALEGIAARAGGQVSVERPTEAAPLAARAVAGPNDVGTAGPDTGSATGTARSGAEGLLDVATFDRRLDLAWVRASYTSLTQVASHATPQVGSEPEDRRLSDEPDAGSEALLGSAVLAGEDAAPDATTGYEGAIPAGESVTSPFHGLPGGRETGTIVHRVLEKLDFGEADRPADLFHSVSRLMAGRPAGTGRGDLDAGILAAGLGAALTTALGPLVGSRSLSSISRKDRLDELSFELPVAGGDGAGGWLGVSDIADVLDRHLVAGGPLEGYPDRLRDPLLGSTWRGYLTGSLDLVFRCPGPDGRTRWYVADYKTNQLAAQGRVAVAWDYRPSALEAEMQRSHYPLQALIYSVALHRYLRWRLPGYDVRTDLGGVLYLFLRGMVGPLAPYEDGHPSGVYSWAVPAALVVELSDLFDAGGPAGRTVAGDTVVGETVVGDTVVGETVVGGTVVAGTVPGEDAGGAPASAEAEPR